MSIFLTVLRRISLLFWNRGKWAEKCGYDSTSVPHPQIGYKESWKLCLNLSSRKLLRPLCCLVKSWIPLRLWQLKKLFKFDLSNYKNFFFFKCEIGSNLFYSEIVEGKYKLLRKFCLILNKGTLSTFLVLKAVFLYGTKLKKR